MPWNGSGVFSRLYSWVADANSGIDIMASRMDLDSNDIAQGLMHCLTVNGETVPTANLPMANFRHTGASVGVADTDYCTVGQIKNGGGGLPSGGYLPLAGGTMTGLLTVQGSRLIVYGSSSPSVVCHNTVDNTTYGMWNASGQLEWGTADNTGLPTGTLMRISNAGDLIVSGNLTADNVTGTNDVTALNSLGSNGTLSVVGNGGFGGNLTVTGTATINGNLVSNHNITGQQVTGQTGLGTSGNLSVGGTAGIGSTLSVTGIIRSTGNRVIAQGGSSPSVACYNTVDGTAFGMWDASSQLQFGQADGNGVPLSTLMRLDGNGNLVLGGNLSVGGAAGIGGILTSAGAHFNGSINPLSDAANQCGIPGAAWFAVYSYGYPSPSDRRGKIDIEPLDADCLDLVRGILPQRFRWAVRPEGAPHWGFVAQDVEAVMTAAAHEFGGHLIDDEGRQALAYNELVAVLWRAVQQLSERLDRGGLI